MQFQARHSEHRIDLPLEPMLGTVGVAPASNEVRSSLVPDRFGETWTRRRCAPEDDDHIMTVDSSRPLEDAWQVSQVEMVTWLAELYGLHAMDAYQLPSQISETPL